MNRQSVRLKFDERIIEGLSSKIATQVSDTIYYELLMARHLPEIKTIESGKSSALKGNDVFEYLKQKISLLK